MPGATHQEIALQMLASGRITTKQFNVLRDKFFPPPAPPPQASSVPLHPWNLPLIRPVPDPNAEAAPQPVDTGYQPGSIPTDSQLADLFGKVLSK